MTLYKIARVYRPDTGVELSRVGLVLHSDDTIRVEDESGVVIEIDLKWVDELLESEDLSDSDSERYPWDVE